MLKVEEHMGSEIPVGFILVLSNLEFSDICGFCFDNFDVLEIFIDGTNGLVFYDITELNAVVFYCDSESIEYWKYLIDTLYLIKVICFTWIGSKVYLFHIK